MMSKMCSNEAFARTIGFYLKMPIDHENNLILYGKDTKCQNHEKLRLLRKTLIFSQGGESTVTLIAIYISFW